MQFVGPVLALLSLCGGLFVPLSLLPPAVRMTARFTPVYGVGEIARSPLVGGFTATALLNMAGWALLFIAGAVHLLRRDTARA
jgi:ABC-2 type transport system permease protein